MAVTTPFPFVIESKVTPQRVQLWGLYAMQAVARPTWIVVQHAFDAFDWEETSVDAYQTVCSYLRYSDALSANWWVRQMSWLDHLVLTLRAVADRWQWTAQAIEQSLLGSPVAGSVAEQWHRDACYWMTFAQKELSEVASFVCSQCAAYGLPVPKNSAAFTAA